jgi:hypothetical protein
MELLLNYVNPPEPKQLTFGPKKREKSIDTGIFGAWAHCAQRNHSLTGDFLGIPNRENS